MWVTRRWLAGLILAALLTPPAAGDALDSALAQLPAETQAAIVLPDLAEANRVLGELTHLYDLPLPRAGDLLSAFKREAGMYGVNDEGPLLIAFTDPAAAWRDGTSPTAFMLVPVSDYAAFVENYDGDTDAEVTALRLPEHTGYGRRLGEHVVLGRTRESVAEYTPANDAAAIDAQLGDLGRRHLERATAALYVNLAAIRDQLGAVAAQWPDEPGAPPEDSAPEGTAPDGTAPADTEQQAADAGDGAAADGSSFAEVLADSAEALLVAFEADDHGIALTPVLSYRPDSRLAELLPGNGGDLTGELGRLPDRPFIFAAAMDMGVLGAARWLDAAEADAPAQAEERHRELVERARSLLERTEATASAYYVPTRQQLMAGNVLNQVSVFRTDDPEQYRADLKALIEGLDGLSVGPIADDAAGIGGDGGTFATRYIDDALEIAGTGVDQYQLAPPAPMDDALPALGPVSGMLGTRGTTGYIAAAEQAGYVVMTTQPDLQLTRRTLEAIERGDGLGGATAEQLAQQRRAERDARGQGGQTAPAEVESPQWFDDDARAARARSRRGRAGELGETGPTSIAEMRRLAMPDSTVFEGYVSLAGIASALELVMPVAEMVGVQVPDELAPVALGLGLGDDGLVGRLYLSHRTAALLVDLGMQLQPMLAGETEPTPGDERSRQR